MTKNKLILILTSAVVLIAACLSGCSVSETETQPTPQPSPTSAPTEEALYEETLQMLIMPKEAANTTVALSPTALTIAFLEEKYNLQITFIDTLSYPDKTYSEILGTFVASGVIPDYMNLDVLSSDKSAYEKLIKAGAVVDVDEFVSKSEARYPRLNEYILQSDEIDRYKTESGSLYCLPNYLGPDDTAYLVRGDWAEKAGIEISDIDTLDEFRLLMETFSESDFDETQPSGFMTGNQRYLDPIFAGFTGCYMFKEINGQFMDWFLLDDMRAALSWLNEMYENQAFDNDYLLHDGAVSEEKITNGTTGAIATQIGNLPALEDELQGNFPDAYLVPLPVEIMGKSGSSRVSSYKLSTAAMVSVYFEDPERIYDICEFLFSNEGLDVISYGIEGGHYTLDGENKIPNFEAYAKEGWKYNSEGLNENIQQYNEIRNLITQIDVISTDNYPQSAVDWYKTLLGYQNIRTNPFEDNGYTPTGKLSGFNAVRDTWVDDFISGKKELSDKNWDKFITEYLEAGAQAQMDFYNNK